MRGRTASEKVNSQMKNKELHSPGLFISRELSWIEFNHRVLEQARSKDVPPAERLKFLAIVSSNLDEFFMIRVAGLMKQRAAGVRRRDLSGLTPLQQLTRISKRIHKMVAQQTDCAREVFGELAQHGLVILNRKDWTSEHRQFLRKHFTREVLPVLTPLAVQQLDPVPLLPGLTLYVAVLLGGTTGDSQETSIIFIRIPALLKRFITIPADANVHLAAIEDVIADNSHLVCPDGEVLSTAVFRITRDADVAIEEDEAEDLLGVIEQAVLSRRRRAAVRLEISARADRPIQEYLMQLLELNKSSVYEIDGVVGASALMEIYGMGRIAPLRQAEWPPQPPRDLIGSEELWTTIRERDVLLFHPYESFEPVVNLLEQAAEDPNVLAIKQTLYRTSGESPIISALERAGRNGKAVTVLVELKARFDEARNVAWARRLEDANCHVIYGVAGLKTHAKALLIVRREDGRIRRYFHLATGNYNDRTAKLYSDVGLMSCDADLAGDVAAFFNLLTGSSESVGWRDLTIAPTELRQKLLDLIEREQVVSTSQRPGLIMAKLNSLEDEAMCRALYRASQAGVQVKLNIRGICCLQPGLKGISENIHVCSIVDRFLEHARILYFQNARNPEVYLSSADWMKRNLSRRLELLFPVKDRNIRRRLTDALKTYFADNVKSWQLLTNGTYERIKPRGKLIAAQEKLYHDAVEAAREAEHLALTFRPLSKPAK